MTPPIIRRPRAAFLMLLALSACAGTPEPESTRPVFIPRPVPVRPAYPVANYQVQPPAEMVKAVRDIWAASSDRVGVAVARADGSWSVSHRGQEYMPQQSVSKTWVALAVLDAVDKGRLALDDKLTLTDKDLTLFHQPLQVPIRRDGEIETTIRALLEASMTGSDNTANDVLMRRIGGANAVRAVLAVKGLSGIRFGPGERELQSAIAGLKWEPEMRFGNNFEKARAKLTLEQRSAAMGAYLADPMDGATPEGIARALLKLKRGELLSRASTQHLLMLMTYSTTGKQRLRAGVPMGWSFAHKTGTGQDLGGRTAGYNDVGLMTAPDGTTYAVVVMMAEAYKPVTERQLFMQNIAATIGVWHRK